MPEANQIASEIVRDVLGDGSQAILIAEQIGSVRTIVDANQALLDLLGYELEDIRGRTPKSLLSAAENDFEQINALRPRLRRFGSAETVMSVRRANGETVPLSVHLLMRPSPCGRGGTVVYLCRDATEDEASFRKSPYRNGLLQRAEKIAKAGAWKISTRDRGLSCSDNLLTLLGAAQGDDLPGLLMNFVSRGDIRKFWRAAKRCEASGEPFEMEFEFRRIGDGEIRAGKLSGEADLDIHGQPCGIVGVLVDITEIARAREENQRAETDHRSTLDLVEVGLFTRNVRSGDVCVDTHAAEMIGLKEGQRVLSSQALAAIVHPDDWRQLENNFNQRHQTEAIIESHTRLCNTAGEYHWFSIRSRGVPDDNGEITQSCGTIANIDQVKQSETAFSLLETQFRRAVSATGIGIVNMSDGVCHCSREVALILEVGDSAFEWDRETWRKRIHPDDRNAALQPLQRENALKRGEVLIHQYRMKTESGRYHWIETRKEIEALDENNIVSAYSGVVIDIDERKRAEETLERVQNKLDIGVRAARIGLFDINEGQTLAYFSTEVAEILGMEPVAFERPLQWWIDQIHPDDRPDVRKKGLKNLQSGRPFEVEYRLRRADGDYVWVEARSTYTPGADGKPVLTHGAILSIEDRKRAEIALNRLEILFDVAAKSANIGVYEGDLRTEKAAYSAAIGRMLGLPEETITCEKSWWRDRIHPDDLDRYDTYTRERVEISDQITLEYRLRREDGTYIWIEARTALYARNSETPTHIVGAILDIDERKRSEIEMGDLRERFDWARSAGRVGLWSWDAEADEAVWSPECVDVLKLPPDTEFRLATVMDRAHPDDMDKAWGVINRVMKNGEETFVSRFRYITDEDEIIWIETIGRATHGPDGPMKIFGSLRDVTNEAEHALALETARDAAEKAAAAKASFLATMSHEIRTPLNAVIGMTSLLMRSPLNDTQSEYAETANTAGEHLLCLVNDVLDLTKLEADRVELDETPFDLSEEVMRVVAMMKPALNEKGLALKVDIKPDAEGLFIGDAPRLRQVLLNLISNAVKFTEKGEIRVAASVTLENRVSLSVSDTGIGISENARRRLFDDFVQADAGINRRYGGTGLGLSICRRLIELMNGEIGIDSVPGQGSVFWFELPLECAEKESVSDQDGDDLQQTGLRVLAADDNAANRLLLKTILELFECEVELVEDGLQAVEAANLTRFDVIILDVEMPNMDGMEAVRRIRQSCPHNSAAPVLALTAHSGRRTELMEAGFDEALSKPFSAQTLAAQLAKFSGSGRTDDTSGKDRKTANMTDHTDTPLVNQATLDPLMAAAGADVVGSIVAAFCGQADELVDSIEAAVKASDPDRLRKTAHELKGCAANVGAGRISAIAGDIETQTPADAASAMPELRAALIETRPALTEFVKNAA